MPSGLGTSPWRTRWTAVRTGPCPPAVTPAPPGPGGARSGRCRPRRLSPLRRRGRGGRGRGGVGQRVGDDAERVVVEGRRDEAGLEHGRRGVGAAGGAGRGRRGSTR